MNNIIFYEITHSHILTAVVDEIEERFHIFFT